MTVLWEYFTMALPDSDLEKSRDAILLLGMCGASEVFVTQINILAINYWLFSFKVSIISANIMVIVDNGLSERATLDFRLARNSCEALLR